MQSVNRTWGYYKAPLPNKLELDKQLCPLRTKLSLKNKMHQKQDMHSYLKETDWFSSQDLSNMSKKSGVHQKGRFDTNEGRFSKGDLKGNCELGTS